MKMQSAKSINAIWLGTGTVCLFLLLAAGGQCLGQTNTFPASGNVGIGTTTPSSQLTVTTSGTNANTLSLLESANDTPTTFPNLVFQRSRGTLTAKTAVLSGDRLGGFAFRGYGTTNYNLNNDNAVIRAFAAENFTDTAMGTYITFETTPLGAAARTEKLRITSNGNIGIGTTTPGGNIDVRDSSGRQMLLTGSTSGSHSFLSAAVNAHLSGNLYFNQTNWNRFDTSKGGAIVDARGDIGVIDFLLASSGANPVASFNTAMRIDSTGNVGIGTVSPSSKLHIVSGTDNGVSLLHLDTGVHGGTSMAVYGTINNESGFDMSVYRAGQYFSRFGVTNYGNVYLQPGGGNVGIGSSTPGFRLDVQGGQINSSGGLCIAGDCKTAWSQVGGSSQWQNSGSNINYSSGNVGVGIASPVYSLDVNGGTNAFRAKASTASGSDTIATFEGSAGIAAIVRANGNVGIGTATPTRLFSLNASSTPYLSFNEGGTEKMVIGTEAAGYSRRFIVFDSSAAQYRFVIDNSGNVGIGTTSPTKKLDVSGDMNASGTITAGNIVAKYQDVAEWVPSSETLVPATVVVLDSARAHEVIASTHSYDTRVAGVISAQPGIILGEGGNHKVLVATTGRVRLKVDASRGPIQIGDLLVTSDIPGVAMKSEPVNLGGVQIHRPGTIIGKALEPLAKGQGEILALLSLQ